MFRELMTEIRKFNSDRDWDGDHTPKNLAMSVVIEAAELSEHFQWVSEEESWYVPDIDKVSEEVADVMIYLLNLCDKLGINMYDAIRLKIRKNSKRFPIKKYIDN